MDELKKEEFKDFVETCGIIGADAHLYSSGLNFIEKAGFNEWVQQAKAFGIGDLLTKPEIANELYENGKSLRLLVQMQGKGYEWDYAMNHRHSIRSLWEVVKLDPTGNSTAPGFVDSRADALRINRFTGKVDPLQMKSDVNVKGKVVDHWVERYPDDTVFVTSKEHSSYFNKNHPHAKHESFKSAKEIASDRDKRVKDLMKGNVEQITVSSALKQIGKGAIIGSVVRVGIGALTSYKSYKYGHISGEEFRKNLLTDAAHGAISGGAFAACNLIVQKAALALGVGNPVVIPVMIVVGFGLEKLIAPAFGRGEYQEIVNEMEMTTDLMKSFDTFTKNSLKSYELLESVVIETQRQVEQFGAIQDIHDNLDESLKNEMEKW
jgi:hypothetical protein